LNIVLSGVANQVAYSPASASDWNPVPTQVATSLDQLAAKGPNTLLITSLHNGANNDANLLGFHNQFGQTVYAVVEPGATTAPFSFTGFVAPTQPVSTNNMVIEITNESSFPMSLNTNNIGSAVGNRIFNATDFDLQNVSWARLRYDTVNSGWWVDDWNFAEQAIPGNIGQLVSTTTSSITLGVAGTPSPAVWPAYQGPVAASGSANNAALVGNAPGGTITMAQPGTYRVDCTISAVVNASDVYKLILTVNGVAASVGLQNMVAGQIYTLTTPTLVQAFNAGDVVQLEIEAASVNTPLFNWVGSLTVDQRY